MPSRQWFPRAVTARGPTLLDGPGAIATSSGLTVTGTLNLSSGIDWPLTTGPSTGTDLVLGSRQVLITTSDGGYYRLDPPATVGMEIDFLSGGTTASTHYVIPDTTSVLFYTSSGSSGGRVAAINGQAAITFLALTTAQWIISRRHGGNIVTSSST